MPALGGLPPGEYAVGLTVLAKKSMAEAAEHGMGERIALRHGRCYNIVAQFATFFHVACNATDSMHELQKNAPSRVPFLNARRTCAGLIFLLGALCLLCGIQSHEDRRPIEIAIGFAVALSALAYLSVDALLIWADRAIRAGTMPAGNARYTTLSQLESAIRLSLRKGQAFRVDKDSLDACWPGLNDDAQAEKIALFAVKNDWVVSFRRLGPLGTVAEFEKTSDGA